MNLLLTVTEDSGKQLIVRRFGSVLVLEEPYKAAEQAMLSLCRSVGKQKVRIARSTDIRDRDVLCRNAGFQERQAAGLPQIKMGVAAMDIEEKLMFMSREFLPEFIGDFIADLVAAAADRGPYCAVHVRGGCAELFLHFKENIPADPQDRSPPA